MAGTRGSGIGPAEQAYLDTLGAALWGRAPEVLPANVEAVLQIANLHKTRPLILNALQKAGLDDLDDKTWSLIYKTASLHLTLNRYLVRLVAFFEKNGIKTVLLKGAGVAANYPEPVLRECGDIDLYVGPEQYERACALMREFIAGTNVTKEKLSEKHFTVCSNGVYVELHQYCDILRSKRENAYFQSIAKPGLTENLASVTITDSPINTPADSFNAFFLFEHIWYHLTNGGIGFRQICDWILFLHSRAGKLDTSVVDEALTKLKLRSAWQILGSIAVDYLGMPADEMPFYVKGLQDRAASILGLILQEGNFGYAMYGLDKRPTEFTKNKWFSMKVYLKRAAIFFRCFSERRLIIIRDVIYYLFDGVLRVIKHIFKR